MSNSEEVKNWEANNEIVRREVGNQLPAIQEDAIELWAVISEVLGNGGINAQLQHNRKPTRNVGER